MENLAQTPEAAPHYDASSEIRWLEETEAQLRSELSEEERVRLNREYYQRLQEEEYRLADLLRRFPGRYDLDDIQYLDERLLEKQAKARQAELEKEQEERESKIPKNLLTNFDDTLRAMALIEGKGWLGLQTNEEGQTVAHALKAIRKYAERPSGSVQRLFCIYGTGGYHRYWVDSDGTVNFSAGHAMTVFNQTERVRRLGFSIIENR